jgi:uncharacterized membrane protein SirB2
MSLVFLKYFHIVSAAASFALFFVRGLWVMQSYPDPQEKWVRALPHLVDAVLVLSAVAMLALSPLNGWPGDWLTVKLGLVAVYAMLSLYLFRGARLLATKILSWLLGLLVFLYTTTIAVLHNPLGILSAPW